MLNNTTIKKEGNTTVAYDSNGNPIDLSSFVSFDATKNLVELVESIKEDMNNGSIRGIDLSESWLETHISGQKPYTHRLANIWQCQRDYETSFISKWHYRGIASHRLSRFLNHEKLYYHSKKKISLHNGTEVEVLVRRQYLSLENDPILYIQFQEDGDDPNQAQAYKDSIEEIRNGLEFRGKRYEYCFSSGSQLRTLKGVMVWENYKLPETYLSQFDRSIEGMDEYLGFLRSLTGADCILETMTYGAYSHEFSNGYKEYLRDNQLSDDDFDELLTSASKFMARVGVAGTASESLGHNWRVKHMGEARFVWTDKIEEMFLNYEVVGYDGVSRKLYSESDVATIKNMWKEGKLDGQSIARASSIQKALRKIGIYVEYEDVVGRLLQLRWAGVKGTVLVIADDILDMCRDPQGKHIYKNYDMIIEHNSWKYSPTKYYTGVVGPEFELVNMSKKKYSNNLNYQFILALDGDGNHPEKTLGALKGLVDKQLNSIKECLTNPEAAMIRLGMTDKADSPLEDLGIDEYEMTQRNKITKALAKSNEVVYDKWFRKKFLDLFRKTEDECKLGKIEVEGANRYIISDPIAMLRTDLIEINEKTGLEDIIITDPSQVALRYMTHCYWAGKEQEAVLFRSPCIHPGEPQKVMLTNEVQDYLPTAFGQLPVRKIYDSMKDIIVINGFSNILECLGGADTDGDTALCVTDPEVVALKDNMRKPLLVSADAGTNKIAITKESIKENMVFSLKNNGIGLITNFATTWRDIQLHIVSKRSLTSKMKKELKRLKSAAKENYGTQMPWAVEDSSIETIMNMNINDWRSVYKACNAALRQLRILQEMSINTAKSGVFVEFGSEDINKNNYNHLAIKIRACWHKPNAPEYQRYESGSIMAELNKYVQAQWKELEDWANKTSSALLPGVKANYGVNYVEVFNTINSLRAYYGTIVYELRLKELTKEEFNEQFESLSTELHTKLTILAAKYGVDLVAVACYDASNKESRSKKQADGTSFVWNCFFEEFLATLDFLDTDRVTHRIYKVFLKDEFTYERFTAGGTGRIEEGRVFLDNIEIGSSPLEEGEYDIIIIDGAPYIKAPVVKSTIEELTVTLSGTRFAIVGITNNDDKVTGEGKLTRDSVISYLSSPLNRNIITTKSVYLGSNPNPSVGCYIRGSANSMMLIGVIPMEEKTLANALDSKAFKVSIPNVQDTDKRLTIEITEILKDYL